jgi:putative transposase
LRLLAEGKALAGVGVWAYCLMPNHVHIVAVPEKKDGLSQLFRFVHRHYSRRINFREKWKGHLWQERFHSFVMDERYLLATVRYTELNPVRAGLCKQAEDWPWSSARAHLIGCDDVVTTVQPMLDRIADWRRYLTECASDKELEGIRRCSSTGRPAGDTSFLTKMEALTGRELRKRKPGPRPAIK